MIFGIACLLSLIQFSIACNDKDVEVLSVTNGKKNNINIKPDVYATLTKNCTLIVNATFSAKTHFEIALVSYEIKMGFLTVFSEDDLSLCSFFKEFEISVPCPINEAGTYCTDPEQEINIEKYKHLLKLACGEFVVVAKVCYDKIKVPDTFEIRINFCQTGRCKRDKRKKN